MAERPGHPLRTPAAQGHLFGPDLHCVFCHRHWHEHQERPHRCSARKYQNRRKQAPGIYVCRCGMPYETERGLKVHMTRAGHQRVA